MPGLRFVILEHDHPFLHWDLLLQDGNVLKAWRLLKPVQCGTWIPAETLPDHRLLYLDYEGPITNHRGNVTRVAAGRYTVASLRTDLLPVTAAIQNVEPSPVNAGFATESPRELSLILHECDLATRAQYRVSTSDQPQWQFA